MIMRICYTKQHTSTYSCFRKNVKEKRLIFTKHIFNGKLFMGYIELCHPLITPDIEIWYNTAIYSCTDYKWIFELELELFLKS